MTSGLKFSNGKRFSDVRPEARNSRGCDGTGWSCPTFKRIFVHHFGVSFQGMGQLLLRWNGLSWWDVAELWPVSERGVTNLGGTTEGARGCEQRRISKGTLQEQNCVK